MKDWGVGKLAAFFLYSLLNDAFYIGGAVWLVVAYHWTSWVVLLGILLACGQWRPKEPKEAEPDNE